MSSIFSVDALIDKPMFPWVPDHAKSASSSNQSTDARLLGKRNEIATKEYAAGRLPAIERELHSGTGSNGVAAIPADSAGPLELAEIERALETLLAACREN